MVLPCAINQLLGGFHIADDLLGCVPGSFLGGVPGPVWPAEDSHSPRTEFQGPRQMNLLRRGGYRSIRQGLRELAYAIKDMLALGGVEAGPGAP